MAVNYCYYCGCIVHKEQSRKAPGYITKDHVYPRQSAEYKAHRGEIAWNTLNLVNCCQSCNSYKGHLHPLDWLLLIKNNQRAKLLAERLIKMGEGMPKVFDVMMRRKK